MSDAVGIFHNSETVEKLVGAALAEQHDDWIQQKHYMSLTSLAQTKAIMAASIVDENSGNGKKIAA